MTGGRLPNLVVAGVTKAGTTTLFHCLVQHPEICGGTEKQVAYFSPLRHAGGELGPLDEYRAAFRGCTTQRYALDATPNYFTGGGEIVDAIKATLDEPKIVLSFREPADRVWSSYRYARSRARIPTAMTFEGYVDEGRRLYHAGEHLLPAHRAVNAYGTGFYGDEIDAWLSGFGDDLRVIFFDDIVADVQRCVVDLCGWLGIDVAIVDSFDLAPRNTTVDPRRPGLRRLGEEVLRIADPMLTRVPKLRAKLVDGYHAVNSRDSDATRPADVLAGLRVDYAASNQVVADRLRARGYELPSWLSASPVS